MERGGSSLGNPNYGAAAALDQNNVIPINTAIRRPSMDAKAGLDRLAAIQDGREKGLDEDGKMNADGDLSLAQLPA